MTEQPSHTAEHNPTRARPWLLPGLLLLLVAGGVAAAFVLTAPTPKRRPSKPHRPLVSVAALAPSRQCVSVTAHGRVEPVNRLDLVPQVAGRVVRVHPDFVPGGRIPAGGEIVALEQTEYRAALLQARAELKTAEERLRLEKARRDTARTELKQFGTSKISDEQRDLATRGPQVRIQQAAVERARAKVSLAELSLRRTRIRFDMPVVIESMAVGRGSVARVGQVLGVAYPLDTLWVDVAVPVNQLRWFIPGQHRAEVFPGGGGVIRGQIRKIRPAVEPKGSLGRVLVEVSLPAPQDGQGSDGQLPMRAGEFVKVTLFGRCLDRVFALPRRAVRGDSRVWLVDDDHKLRIVTIRPEFVGKDRVLVRGVLRAGQRLITSALSRPVAGMGVRVAGPDRDAAPSSGGSVDAGRPDAGNRLDRR